MCRRSRNWDCIIESGAVVPHKSSRQIQVLLEKIKPCSVSRNVKISKSIKNKAWIPTDKC